MSRKTVLRLIVKAGANGKRDYSSLYDIDAMSAAIGNVQRSR